MRLNLGSGPDQREDGWISVDRVAAFEPDVVCDLEVFPWPWEEASVSEIRMYHVLEHLGHDPRDFLEVMCELYRILEPGGLLHILVPHLRSDNHWGNFTHVRPITNQLLLQFDRQIGLMPELWLERGIDFEMVESINHLTPHWVAARKAGVISDAEVRNAERDLWNVVSEVSMILRKRV